ncbi:MAG: hypothetical protein ACI8QP_000186 [Porticoccaceae bacterium]|jgi:hypothetical protein
MKTKIVMTSCAIFLGVIGILLSFLPSEIITYLGVEPTIITTLFLKILSALYLGFGILNWMAKGSIIGGIYNRPIVIGNLMHFGVGAIALIKIVSHIEIHSEIIISLTILYVIFTILFTYIFKNNPATVKKQS